MGERAFDVDDSWAVKQDECRMLLLRTVELYENMLLIYTCPSCSIVTCLRSYHQHLEQSPITRSSAFKRLLPNSLQYILRCHRRFRQNSRALSSKVTSEACVYTWREAMAHGLVGVRQRGGQHCMGAFDGELSNVPSQVLEHRLWIGPLFEFGRST